MLYTLAQIQTTVSLEWLIGTTIGIFLLVGGAWLNMRTNMALINAKLLELEKDIKADRNAVDILKTENRSQFEKIDSKLDTIINNQAKQAVQIALKEDKK